MQTTSDQQCKHKLLEAFSAFIIDYTSDFNPEWTPQLQEVKNGFNGICSSDFYLFQSINIFNAVLFQNERTFQFTRRNQNRHMGLWMISNSRKLRCIEFESKTIYTFFLSHFLSCKFCICSEITIRTMWNFT